MAIREFEFLHGAVLTKLLRKDEPLTLTLIETNKEEAWSAYKITAGKTDSVLYMKCSTSPRKTDKHSAWVFSFRLENLQELQKYKDQNLFLALICAQSKFATKPSEICFLDRKEIFSAIDIYAFSQQTITVYAEPKKKLRVVGTLTNNEKMKIERSRISKLVF